MEIRANKCKVLYRSKEGGKHTYDGTKIVFQHREGSEDVKEGLVVPVEGTYRGLGTYAFSDFENVESVEPDDYRDIRNYKEKSVPLRVYKGEYGDNIFLKEEYTYATYIRAYTREGDVLLYEREEVEKRGYCGKNMYYSRIDEVITEWEDITEGLYSGITAGLHKEYTEIDITGEAFLETVKGIYKAGVKRLPGGLIVAQGKYEHKLIWSEEQGEINTVWIGILECVEEIDYEDITEEVREAIEGTPCEETEEEEETVEQE